MEHENPDRKGLAFLSKFDSFTLKNGHHCKFNIKLYLLGTQFLRHTAWPHSSVGSIADLKTGGRWFDPRLGQYSFQGLMIVIATGFILSHLCLLF